MIGIVLVTHGQLADAFRAALEHVVGPQQQLMTICIKPDDDMERHRRDIIDAIAAVDSGEGVVLLTDMFGGTPSNLVISLLEKNKVEVLAGVNLPMLIKLASVRDTLPLDEAIIAGKENGRKYISVASEVLAGGKKDASASRADSET